MIEYLGTNDASVVRKEPPISGDNKSLTLKVPTARVDVDASDYAKFSFIQIPTFYLPTRPSSYKFFRFCLIPGSALLMRHDIKFRQRQSFTVKDVPHTRTTN
ncbi:hypothetical protein H2248_005485 [Termitomyces sp. 'cryptogamus']|nr:hypothetical protein H2248_005485 [Termitomyces sp. 'cryptogamus']